MNIIHNSSQKFVPNRLFNQVIDLQHDYLADYQKFSEDSNKENTSESGKNGIKLKKSLKFKDRTNHVDESSDAQKVKNISVKALLTKQVCIRSSHAEETENDSNPLKEQAEPEKIRKPKTKKKISPRKNNLKQLFLEMEQNIQADCIFTEKSQKLDQEELNQDEAKLDIQEKPIENQSSIKHQNGNEKIKEKQPSQPLSARSTDVNPISMFKINKFHFLHNELNLDSSQDEQNGVNHVENSMKHSSSSENDEQKISVQMPKIRSRNNFFLKNEDLNFDDDSSDSDEKGNKNQSIKQIPQPKDHVKEGFSEFPQSQQPHEQKSLIKTLTITDFRRQFVESHEEYLKKSLPVGISVDLIVKRDKSKRNSDYVEYHVYDGKTLRVLAIVVKKSSVHEILAKTNVENPKAHPDLRYLTAKLESNFLGSEFSLKYVPKNSPQSNAANKPTQSSLSSKQQLAGTICYQTNILGLKGPRKINIYIPENNTVKYYGDKSLQSLHSKKCGHRIQKYINKQAKWNNDVQSYVLNLRGKAKLSSVKNFVIVRDQEIQDDRSFVIFGKSGKDIFNLAISGPFSILQGISVAMSTFDRKFTCE